jgi:hypothetical protein
VTIPGHLTIYRYFETFIPLGKPIRNSSPNESAQHNLALVPGMQRVTLSP